MTDRPATAEDVKALVDEREIRFIRFWFTDILGQLKSFSINAAELDDAFEGGMGFDGSSITGFNAIEESDMIAQPDPSTFAVLPWRPEDRGVGRMFCDVVTPDRQPYEGDPRYVLRRALQRAEDMGVDAFNVGPELEFFYFRSAKPDVGTPPEVLDDGGYFDLTTLKGGRNAFYDGDDQYYLSDVGKAFIAGQLKHARELSSIFAQWVNSYKRLVPGFEAPVYVAWSRRNRSALVRVPLYHPGKEQATRMELRCPDPACNPYLTFAVLLQAGLEGVEKGYELPDPMEKNLYHLSPDERRRLGIEQLPETLGEAIELTAESELVLRTLGELMFNRYIEIKRKEWDEYRIEVTRWELDRYLAIL